VRFCRPGRRLVLLDMIAPSAEREECPPSHQRG
jgi:hypothetical protein